MARIITLEDVGMRWDGKTVLSGIDLSVNEGDFIAMTGPNGGGEDNIAPDNTEIACAHLRQCGLLYRWCGG